MDRAAAFATRLDAYVADRRAQDARYSLGVLAAEVGCGRVALYRLRSGDRAVSIDLIQRVAQVTGIPAVDLFADWERRNQEATQAA